MSELLTVKDVAEMVGVTPQTVHRWMKDGIGPRGIQLPGGEKKKSYRFRQNDVDSWFDTLATAGPETYTEEGDPVDEAA